MPDPSGCRERAGARISGEFYCRGARVVRGAATEPPPDPFTGCESTEKLWLKVNGTIHFPFMFCPSMNHSEVCQQSQRSQ
jgi:hypothetical protein